MLIQNEAIVDRRERPINQKEKIITLGAYAEGSNGRYGIDEVSGAVRENLKADEAERINPYILCFTKDGVPNFKFEKETVLGQAEYVGMLNMRDLANEGYEYLIWISPPYGRSGYIEGRVVVGKVKKVDGKEVEIECRGIPIKRSAENLLTMTRYWEELGAISMDEIRKPEDLREQALGINLENDSEFWDRCEEVFGNRKVWEYIREGKDVRNKKATEEVVGSVWGEVERKAGGRITWENSAWASIQFEMMMVRRGYQLMAGNHGGVNFGGGMPFGASLMTAFDSLYTSITKINTDPRLEECHQCHNHYMKKKGKCPRCYPDN